MARLTAPNGAIVNVSDEKAKRLLGEGYKAIEGKAAKSTGTTKGAAQVKSESAGYDGQKVGELTKLAADRQLEVTGTGKDGKVVKADLVAALTASDEAAANSDDGVNAGSED